MQFLKIFNIIKLVIDGTRAITRIIRKDKPKNQFERVLEDIDDVADILPFPESKK